MEGITTIINELGLMIMAKDLELKDKQDEIDALKKKIELVEQYLDTYDKIYSKS